MKRKKRSFVEAGTLPALSYVRQTQILCPKTCIGLVLRFLLCFREGSSPCEKRAVLILGG